VHLTTREVVYESLSFRHRRDLHTKIGEVIEEIYAGELSEYTNLLAYHYFEGQTWDRALDYNLKSARRAQREFANDTAISSCQRALTAAAKLRTKRGITEQVLAAHEILGEVLTLVGRYDEALKHYGSARNILQRRRIAPERQAHLADLNRKTADVYERQSEYETAFEWLDKGLKYLDEAVPTIETVRIYMLKAGVHNRQGKLEEAIDWCQRTLDAASGIKTRESEQVVAQAYYNLGLIHTKKGEMAKSVEYCRQSIRIYEAIDDIVGQARAYNNLGIAYSDMGDWEQARQAYNNSLATNQRIGNVQEQGFVANNLANIHLYRGEWDQALDLFKQSNAIWRQIGAILPEAVLHSNLAQVYIYQEQWSNAHEDLNRSQDLFSKTGSEDFLPELERRWAEYYLGRDELDQALEHIKRSTDLASEQDMRQELGVSLRIFGEIHQARKDFDSAKIALDESLSILDELDSEYEAAKTMLSLGGLDYEQGATLNRERLERASRTFERLGARVDLENCTRLLNDSR
jgi:tetratricopeptide (TPR) repeat protein